MILLRLVFRGLPSGPYLRSRGSGHLNDLYGWMVKSRWLCLEVFLRDVRPKTFRRSAKTTGNSNSWWHNLIMVRSIPTRVEYTYNFFTNTRFHSNMHPTFVTSKSMFEYIYWWLRSRFWCLRPKPMTLRHTWESLLATSL